MHTNKGFSELEAIDNFMIQNQVLITKSDAFLVSTGLIPMELSINGKSYIIQVFDEYNDLQKTNIYLDFLLVFREIAYLFDANDFLEWCQLHHLDASNTMLLEYYKTITPHLSTISCYFPNNTVDYYISDIDFQLSSGVMGWLRK